MTLADFQLVGFLGRFHPLVVHLPIGFLIIGGLLDYISYRKGLKFDTAISWIYLCGAIAAVVAVILGWMLGSTGGYDEGTLYWHRLTGIAVAFFSILVWLARTGKVDALAVAYKPMILGLLVAIVITGHLGGNLTHGPDYLLEYAPTAVTNFLGKAPAEAPALSMDPDSVLVFGHLIQPMLKDRCVECHNASKMKGDLSLEDREGILQGGDNGEILVPGEAVESELFRRITLAPDHKKFMPAQGKTPLSYHQVKLIEWWINSGAAFDGSVTETGVPPDIKYVLATTYGLDTDPKSYVEKASVAPAEPGLLEQLEKAGFFAQPIAANNNFLEIKKKKTQDIDKASLALITNVKEQVTWLYLGEAQLMDLDIRFLSELPNLTRLRLENNPITDSGLKSIQGLQYLESLNLYGTKVTIEALETFKTLPSLKKLYLWQTGITADDVEQIRMAIPQLEVDAGLALNMEANP